MMIIQSESARIEIDLGPVYTGDDKISKLTAMHDVFVSRVID